ncbi:hypothetical protein RQP46_009853 [Phenoliferia psychrophenolica]
MARRANHHLNRRTSYETIESSLESLKSKTGPISGTVHQIVAAATTASNTTTLSAIGGVNATLTDAITAALDGVMDITDRVATGTNLNAVAWLIVNIIQDLEGALSPTLAPLVTVLAQALNGPVVMLLRNVTGLTTGLLALVQKLLDAVGVADALHGVSNLVGRLVTFLGI